MLKNLLLTFIALATLSSCVAVKEYDKMYLNDPDMLLSLKKSKKYVTTFHSYREAAVGANGGKTGGGCGCN